jgi:hypothetical protein
MNMFYARNRAGKKFQIKMLVSYSASAASILIYNFILPGIVFPQTEKKNGQGCITGFKNNAFNYLLPILLFDNILVIVIYPKDNSC